MKVYLAFERGIQLARQCADRLQAWQANRRAARISSSEGHETPRFEKKGARVSFMSSHPAVVATAILTPSAGSAGTRAQRGHLRYSA